MQWDEPYPGMPSMKVMEGVAYDGLRPTIPDFTPALLKGLLEECYLDDTAMRPTFSDVLKKLEKIEPQLREKGLI